MTRYPEEVRSFIDSHIEGTPTKDLVKLVNAEFGPIFTESKMKSYKTNHKLKSGTPCGNPAGLPSKAYPAEIKCFIEQNHVGVGSKEMSVLLNNKFSTNYTPGQMKSYYGNHKIDSGNRGFFKKGHIPTNKGKKGYCAPGSEKGWFPKGNTPKNHKPVGSERIEVKDGYTLVKVAEPNKWRPKHKVLWEEANGPIPVGHVVTFLDGDKSNITLDNLALITMAESLQLTRLSLRSSDPEFTKTGILIARVRTTAFSKKKKQTKKLK